MFTRCPYLRCRSHCLSILLEQTNQRGLEGQLAHERSTAAAAAAELAQAQESAAEAASAHVAALDAAKEAAAKEAAKWLQELSSTREAVERAERKRVSAESCRQATILEMRHAQHQAAAEEEQRRSVLKNEREQRRRAEAELDLLQAGFAEAEQCVEELTAQLSAETARASEGWAAAEAARQEAKVSHSRLLELEGQLTKSDDEFGEFKLPTFAQDTAATSEGTGSEDEHAALQAGRQWLKQQGDQLRAAVAQMQDRHAAVEQTEVEAAQALREAQAERAEAAHLSAEVHTSSLEVAQIATRLAEKEEQLAVEEARACELQRRLARAEAQLAEVPKLAARSASTPKEGALARSADEALVLRALASETALAVELQQLEQSRAAQLLELRLRVGKQPQSTERAFTELHGPLLEIAESRFANAAEQGGQEPLSKLEDGASEADALRSHLLEAEESHARAMQQLGNERARELLAAKHKFRALLVSRDDEMRRMQAELRELRATAAEAIAANASLREAPETPVRVEQSPRTPEEFHASARRQAVWEAEIERWRARAQSLEARMKGASEARRQWSLREAELLERVEQQGRMLQSQDKFHLNLQYLRNTLIGALESGPAAFGEVLPLVGAFLEFSPEEMQRVHKAQQLQPSVENWWGLWTAASSRPHTPSTAAEPLLALQPAAPEPAPAPVPAASMPPPSAASTGAEVVDGGSGHMLEIQKKLVRMKRLLAAANKQLEQSQETLASRDREIARLRGGP